MQNAVKIISNPSEPFYTERGLRPLMPFVNLTLEKVVRDFEINTSGTILQRTTQILAFADDIDIIGRTRQAVVKDFVSLEKAQERWI